MELVKLGLKIAIYLAATGGLVEGTRQMMIEAAKAHQKGGLSLGKLNRALHRK